MWKLADTNGDGVLSREEFFAMKRIALLPQDKREELFKRLDKNGDGVLSREELESLVPATYKGRVVRATVAGLFPTATTCTAGGAGDTLVVTGSIYLLGEVMARLGPVSR